MNKIGVSTCGDPFDESFFVDLGKNGIGYTEISYTYDRDFAALDFKKVKKWAAVNGVKIWSIHLPYAEPWDIDICSSDADLRKRTVAFYSDCIKRGSDYGVDKFVIHPANNWVFDESQRQEWIKNSKESLFALGNVADGCGAALCVENINTICCNSDEISDVVSVNDKLRICFDLNHSLHQDNADFLRKIKDKLLTIHVSDYDFVEERHWFPGEGKNDWVKLNRTLNEIGYDGVFMYEVGASPKLIRRTKKLSAADFYRNATEIFNEKPITVFCEKQG